MRSQILVVLSVVVGCGSRDTGVGQEDVSMSIAAAEKTKSEPVLLPFEHKRVKNELSQAKYEAALSRLNRLFPDKEHGAYGRVLEAVEKAWTPTAMSFKDVSLASQIDDVTFVDDVEAGVAMEDRWMEYQAKGAVKSVHTDQLDRLQPHWERAIQSARKLSKVDDGGAIVEVLLLEGEDQEKFDRVFDALLNDGDLEPSDREFAMNLQMTRAATMNLAKLERAAENE